MFTRDALEFFGSKTRVAEAAGIRLPSFYKWKELVPEARAMRLQEASGGVLTYDPVIYDQHKQNRREELKNANHSVD
ncbi:Cro/CI family transcriptional regulator [Escherichia albertii]|uniref:Cro/CI family transcriptional regulator n=1 Tax=Escherichia albertii TaxID=208962 RepID=UPI0007431980|nr:Cro/CI family transcriptional regulator [Escherichia albertii]MCI5275829.1 transcriptional regulator [Escherichia albertii]MCZ8661475.1 Cro/CI family transcriptional regulator [Escherichia albertii]MCZ9009717.1 Cro/CI family transcriptional regulator [Escherichia albertii]HCZ5333266.1 transcriptional regulator [Escherichia albertii]